MQINKSGDLEISLQDAEEQENRVFRSVQIFADTLKEIRSEANRLKESEPKKRQPSAAKVIERAWKLYRSSSQKAPAHGKSLQTVPPIYSLLPENVGKLSPGDLEWLRRLVGVAVERLNATDEENERSGNDPLADPDKRIAALRTEADRIDEATKKLQRSPAPDTGTERRPGKRGGGASKPTGGGGRD